MLVADFVQFCSTIAKFLSLKNRLSAVVLLPNFYL